MTVYAFGSEEYFYSPNGTFSNCKHYYTLAGHLIAELNGSTLQFELTDALGSVLMSLSSSAVLGEQVYGPYGNRRYTTGSMGTNQGYTGQTNDPLTGLDYYNARYYDPVVGVFLSADNVQGNVQGMDPYAYVAGNPETLTDPTGHMACTGTGYDICDAAGKIVDAAWDNTSPTDTAVAVAATTIVATVATLTTGAVAAGVLAVAVIAASVGLMFLPYQDTPPNYGNGPQPQVLPTVPTSSPSGDVNDDDSTDFVNSHILNRYRPNPNLLSPNNTGAPSSAGSGGGAAGSGGAGGPPRKLPTSITPTPPGGDDSCDTFYRFVRKGEDPSSYRQRDFKPKNGMVQTGMGTSLITKNHPYFQKFASNPDNLAYEVTLDDLQLPEGMEIIPDGPNHAMIGFTESVNEDAAKQGLQQISGWGEPCQGTDLL